MGATHCVKRVEKWEDPCPLWDDDGQAYLGHSVHGAGPIIVHRMAADGSRLLDEGRTVYTGPVAEGTKWLKRGGYYYLSIPEGGVERGWQTVLRSRSVYGPYERRVVLEQGSTPVNGPHQGALVDTPGGQWWFYHFQSAGPRGRVVHLQPAKWADGWPQIGADLDGNGIGEPVARHAKPATGAAAKPSLPQTSDGFDGTKLYWRGSSRSALMPQWQWCHNPAEGAWSLSERPGWLTLHALRADSLRPCRGMLTQKAMGYGGTATTTVELADSAGGCFAGLLCMGKQFRAVGLCAEGIAVECDGRRTVVARGNFSKARLRVVSDMKANIHRFYYSTDGSDFIPAGGPFAMREATGRVCASASSATTRWATAAAQRSTASTTRSTGAPPSDRLPTAARPQGRQRRSTNRQPPRRNGVAAACFHPSALRQSPPCLPASAASSPSSGQQGDGWCIRRISASNSRTFSGYLAARLFRSPGSSLRL